MAWVLGYPVETALAPVVMALCEPREALKGELPADGDMIFQRQVLCAVLSDPTASLVELSPQPAFCRSLNHSRSSGCPF